MCGMDQIPLAKARAGNTVNSRVLGILFVEAVSAMRAESPLATSGGDGGRCCHLMHRDEVGPGTQCSVEVSPGGQQLS